MNPCELQRDNPFFDRNISVSLVTNPDEAHINILTFRIIPGTRQIKLAGQSERVIHFEVKIHNHNFKSILIWIPLAC
jgi:hypothetical protein